ncbi:MAG TPA: hypothetical protein VMV46_03990 [Thermoanaerobaculia bacterium]|nr:hypothetical protein [Thermoanaerobaculia bacterium]
MRTLPWPEDSLYSLVVRADFTNDAAWQRIRSEIEAPVGEFRAGVRFVDDPRFDQLTVGELLELAEEDPGHFIAFLVDRETLADPEHPILAVDLTEQPGRTVRVLPKAMWDIQVNIALANTDWESYLEEADEKGIYRGFL